ncbi:DNA-binding GntR family transcriptional regulator [Kribbella sp. VKM Ac-2527]|uniref:DNA-binding GntR family transcriptional regulator n=1 Tax=Kribbella caucasensis TaxID=2512215 RepID=A0A4R6JCN6_9ACTN|nr:GntR family transcriptional regulator [Kribbella sp. VKM Ac-2527]TDO33534.1 DNA-binding GntR family transcriptional regulator [Kribbella sp. VKM Ac-2527]
MSEAIGPLPSVRRLTQRESLRDSVANALRAAVISGELKPGEVYSAPTLGARFGVSATPVREAMLDLVREGLVVSLRNKGFRVTEMSDDDLDDLAALRQLIEPPTVRDITPVIPAEDFPRLRALAEDIVVAAKAGNLIDYIEADRVFHVTLLAYSGNRRLVDVVSDLRSKTRLLGLSPLVESGRLVQSADEHHDLMDLIESRDAEGAEALMRHHIGHVRGLWSGPQ